MSARGVRPVRERPWYEMGIKDEEYASIKEILGREPNVTELGMFAAMWSEHCGYKHSRALLSRLPTEGPRVIQGPGENAGIVDIGCDLAVVLKMESHNHPSAIEPYQGAATGVGGILRDIFTMGARPIAVLDSLRFGPLENDRVKYLFDGVVAGISGYGNCVGVPTVAGEVYFDDAYTGNPLVNVMCVGILEKRMITRGGAFGVGNPVIVVGSKTGRDGIHGATFASFELDSRSEERRPAVQVGDPFTEKLLIEASLELIARGCVVGIQDMGAAGITSSASEMAARAGTGIDLDVSLVPRREEGMTPFEVMLSESQERMLVVVEKGREEEAYRIFSKWGLDATVVGHVTDDGLLTVRENGRVVAQIPAKALADAPKYHPRSERPGWLSELHSWDPMTVEEPFDLNRAALEVLSSPSIASKEWVYRQYDHTVQINTAVVPGKADAAVLRIKGTELGLAMTTDANGRYVYLDPRAGAAIAVAEAARNIACVGAEPIAITDCLNFGNPEKPAVFWQFEEAINGITEACRALGIPVVSGNVSFYNESEGKAIYPTPVIGMVGLLEDVRRHLTQSFKRAGDAIVLLGEDRYEMGGSEYMARVHGVVAGKPPAIDLDFERRLGMFLRRSCERGLLASAHDVSEGGILVALAECCIGDSTMMGEELGARVTLEGGPRPDFALFSESQGRVIVSLPKEKLPELRALAGEYAVPCREIGTVGGTALDIDASGTRVRLSLEDIRNAWCNSIERIMGR